MRIRNPDAAAWAFQVEACSRGAPGAVPAWSVSDLLAESGLPRVDVLKMDIEGGEEAIFGAPCPWLADVEELLIEAHGERAAQLVEARTAGRFASSRSGEKVRLTALRGPTARATRSPAPRSASAP